MVQAPFAEFLQAFLRDEPRAITEWQCAYSPYLHRLVGRQLRERGLHYLSEPSDLCQLVVLKVLEALLQGRYLELQTPEHFRRLLTRIALNAVEDIGRKERRTARLAVEAVDGLRGVGVQDLTDPGTSPSQYVSRMELIGLFRDRLPANLRLVHTWRRQGWTWARIGAALGQTGSAIRVRYRRECARVAEELDLGESEGNPGPLP
jgi:DNA-directed RNA polymerase specialized sigma24 family protein